MLARCPGAWGPAQWLKCWSEDGNLGCRGTVQLRLRKPSNAPQGQRIGGYGSVLRPGPMGLRRNKKLKIGLQEVNSESGGIQATGACGPGLQGAWGPGPQGLGPGPPGAWGLFLKNHQPLKLRSFRKPPGGSLAKAWVSAETAASEVGTWRETKPGYPPYPPPPPNPPPRFGAVREKGRGFSPSSPSATIQHAPQGRRIMGIPQKGTPNFGKPPYLNMAYMKYSLTPQRALSWGVLRGI